MSSGDEELLKIYATNERIRIDDRATTDERATAWRKQILIVQHLSSALAVHYLSESYYNLGEKFVNERAYTVDTLLEDFKNQSIRSKQDDYPQLTANIFEPPCHGIYESCRSNEISTEEINLLATIQTHNRNKLKEFCQATPADQNYMRKFCEPQAKQAPNDFLTGREVLKLQNLKTQLNANATSYTSGAETRPQVYNYGTGKKTLGVRSNVRAAFVPPIRHDDSAVKGDETSSSSSNSSATLCNDDRLTNIEPAMIEKITNEIMHNFKPVVWDDIAGLDYAKTIINEAIVYPLLRPDIFKGLRRPPRGILLFGPPGTGKTLIGKCIASQSQSTFFSISASSLTSKYIGDGEKMVRALFAVAAVHQPSVVFIDEIDSLLTQRSNSEHESSRRLKNEFLVQLDGAATSDDDRILIVGATNRPQELDEAARRRLVKRIYIPLPEKQARIQIISNLLQTVYNNLDATAVQEIGQMTDGYSGADMENLCREASMEPIRSIAESDICAFDLANMRPVNKQDFLVGLQKVRPSVSQDDLKIFIEWNRTYGSVR